MQEFGHSVTIWAARAALALYLWSFALQLRGKWGQERTVNTFALAAYLLHVICAFQFSYRWSHSVALEETARQTRELFAVDWGGGLYLNYLLTAVWIADWLYSWRSPAGRRDRPAWAARAVNAFLIFMFFNGSAVVWIMKAWKAVPSPLH